MENVALGFTHSDVSTDRVWECLKIAELEEMFLSLPGGLLTHIGDASLNLQSPPRRASCLDWLIYVI
jgi:ABC-type multidrug transport system fused ATPase/permease subunit